MSDDKPMDDVPAPSGSEDTAGADATAAAAAPAAAAASPAAVSCIKQAQSGGFRFS